MNSELRVLGKVLRGWKADLFVGLFFAVIFMAGALFGLVVGLLK